MSPNCKHNILTQTMAALPIIKEQISSCRAIYLHVLQLPKDWVTLQYVHYHSCIPGEHGHPGRSAMVTSNIMLYSSAGGSAIPSQHQPVHWTTLAQKISGCHPVAHIPLVHLGNTSLQSPHACQSQSQVHNSYK